jgi:hypothetical protein
MQTSVFVLDAPDITARSQGIATSTSLIPGLEIRSDTQMLEARPDISAAEKISRRQLLPEDLDGTPTLVPGSAT